MKLIDDWRKTLKFTSVQLNMFALGCDGVFMAVAVIDEKFYINPILYAAIRMALTAASTLARMIRQDKLNGDDK